MSVVFSVALYLPWCKYLAAQEGVEPQLYADNLKCVSWDPGVLLRAGYVRLIGQEPAPRKCVLISTTGEVRDDMRDWTLADEGDRWTVKLDVRALGGHLDTTFRGWSATLASMGQVGYFSTGAHFHERLHVIWSMFIPGALHGIEASLLAVGSLLKLLSAILRAIWSRRQPVANVALRGVTQRVAWFWFRFRMIQRYLAHHSSDWHCLSLAGYGSGRVSRARSCPPFWSGCQCH